MFDVVWANPERELVGQRKARKGKEKEKREACSSGSGSRSIASAETELSVRSKKPQSFMDSFRLRKKKTKEMPSPPLAVAKRESIKGTRDSNIDSNRDSLLTPPSMTSGPSSPPSPSSRGRAGSLQQSEASFHRDRDRFIDTGSSHIRPPHDVDSILSKWTIPNSLATILSLEEDAELKLRPKESQSAGALMPTQSDIVQTVLHVRSGTSEGAQTTPMPPLTPAPSQRLLHSPLTPSTLASFRKKKKKKAASPQQSMQMHISTGGRHYDSAAMPDLRTPATIVRSGSTSWHATEPWEHGSLPAPLVVGTKASTRSSSGTVSEETRTSTATSHDDVFASLSTSQSALQKQVQDMAAADDALYLRRLTEEWGAWTDAALYKEMEMEKKRWLLSALYGVNAAPRTEIVRLAGAERRIMSFFDTQATASYIAATNPGVPVHHMGPIPLSSRLLPNVSPMQANAASKHSLATTPPVFSDIYTLSLPVLVSASDLPAVLHNMHRVLRPQGILHLFLIDPSPARSVTGPRLQAWLDEHLLLNLERLFRCTSPTRLFSNWLRDAHFQLTSEARVVCTFAAALDDAEQPETAQSTEQEAQATPVVSSTAAFYEPAERQDAATPRPQTRSGSEVVTAEVTAEVIAEVETTETGTEAKTEDTTETGTQTETETEPSSTTRRLQTVIGQKIWQEVWGPYVTADRWWWEDEACREECRRMGTVWEYHIVDAVKKERYVAQA